MRFAVLFIAVCLCAPGFARAHHRTGSSAKHSASHRGTRSHHGRTTAHSSAPQYQATPTPDRYREIQQALADKGYYKGAVNGDWGPDSVDALKRFQADQKLQPDGRINSLSLMAMGLGPKRAPVAKVTAPETNPLQSTPAGSTPNDYRSPEGSQRP